MSLKRVSGRAWIPNPHYGGPKKNAANAFSRYTSLKNHPCKISLKNISFTLGANRFNLAIFFT